MTHNKRNNSYLIKKGLYYDDYSIYSHKKTKQSYPASLSSKKYVTHFDNLPDEILLIIFHYLSPIDVLKSFYGYNNRSFQCITNYRENIDLSKLSYSDYQYFISLFQNQSIQPNILTIGNEIIPTQILLLTNILNFLPQSFLNNIHHLSFTQLCSNDHFFQIKLYLNKFSALKSLRIVSSKSNSIKKTSYIYCNIIEICREFLSYRLNTLELVVNEGIILDKQLSPNQYLKRVTINLQTIDDLLIIFDDFLPNLIFLNVIISHKHSNYQSLKFPNYSMKAMLKLIEFQLETNENILMDIDYFESIIYPLTFLQKLTINIKNWVQTDEISLNENHIEILFKKYLPRLHYFYCSIQSSFHNYVKIFKSLEKHWPIVFKSTSNHIYTIPWHFEHLNLSMLDENDLDSICLNVKYLIVEKQTQNLSHRFSNIETLTIQSEINFSSEEFRRLKHLIINDKNLIFAILPKHIHKLTLSTKLESFNQSNIYPYIRHLILKENEINSLSKLKILVKCFPNLNSIELKLSQNNEYNDCLNLLLNGKHLPHLFYIKTTWIDDHIYCSNTKIWFSAYTPLKYRSTAYYIHHEDKYLTICL